MTDSHGEIERLADKLVEQSAGRSDIYSEVAIRPIDAARLIVTALRDLTDEEIAANYRHGARAAFVANWRATLNHLLQQPPTDEGR